MKFNEKYAKSPIYRKHPSPYVSWEDVKKVGHSWGKLVISAKLSTSDWLNDILISITYAAPG